MDHSTSKIWMNKSILLFLICLTKMIITKDLRIRCNISLVFLYSCLPQKCFLYSGILVGPYKINPTQVNNDFPNYFSSPNKLESVTKNASKKGEKESIFHTESINTPKSPNSRVQSPTRIYTSGCLGLSSVAYVTYSNSLRISLSYSKLEKVPTRWNSRVG